MLLLIESIILCIIFTILILPPLFKDPISMLVSYPPAIRKRVESLPQYQSILNQEKKRQIKKKIIAAIVISILLTIMAYYSGANTPIKAFNHVFLLFFIVNMYDLIVLDIGITCRSKKVIIPGTEDMIHEYRSPWHHVKGACIGTVIGTIVALLSAAYIYVAGMFF